MTEIKIDDNFPRCWITISGATDAQISNLKGYLEENKDSNLMLTNLPIEIWMFNVDNSKWVRIEKTPPIKKGFWNKLREAVKV